MTITRDDVINWLNEYGRVIAENKDYLTQLDSAIGDADHGTNMDRGFKAALAKLPGRRRQRHRHDVQDGRHDPGVDRRRRRRPAVWHVLHAGGHHHGQQDGTHRWPTGRLRWKPR